ncbi:GAF and ANTAR domain-containing protein [Nocardioides litoris]|uniref:GAF and ANTAR domain-containing protein n=1 Tax=Nocardioides litoris TaxID=1926648 RepID=UPI001B8680E4|nr:GAF and ANTAR domain-containing protein [Nocardioides litoris]
MAASFEVMRAQFVLAVEDAEPGLDAANGLCVACAGLLGVDGAAVSMVFDGESRGTFGSSGADSRRLDEYQYTYGEGPCLDAVASRRPVLAPDLDSPHERRWPALAGALLEDGVRGVFALPISVSSVCVGALDLFRAEPGPLQGVQLAGALVAAELAAVTVLELLAVQGALNPDEDASTLGDTWAGAAGMDRIEIYQATGILVSQLGVGPDEAVARLRAHAIATGQTASSVAWAIIARELVLERDRPPTEEGGPP